MNRIALWEAYGLFEAVAIPPPEGPVGAAGQVVNLDQSEGLTDLVPALIRDTREEFDLPSMYLVPIYGAVFDAVLQELAEGRPREEIRALFLESATAYVRGFQSDIMEAVVQGICEAVEDALAGLSRRYESPWRATDDP